MGVYHIAPVGTSPGAVTSALAYLKHNKDKPEFVVCGQIVEAVVLFPSWEVRSGDEGIPEECILNDYGCENKRRSWKPRTAVLDVIRDFVKIELGEEVLLLCCPVKANDYDDCFERMAKVVLQFSAGIGKHLWANLTGGPNIVNAALLEVAFFSGLVARLYYTFLSDMLRYGKYLRPPSGDTNIFDWREVPLVKTAFDEDYYRVLEALAGYGDWIEDKDLLSLLAQEQPERFGSDRMSLKVFLRDFLNKMDGREVEREVLPDGTPTNRNRISRYGKLIVERLTSELFKVLLHPGRREKKTIELLTADLKLERL